MSTYLVKTACLLTLLSTFAGGCVSAQVVSRSDDAHVRLTEEGRILVGTTDTGIGNLARQLKKTGVAPQTQIRVEIPQNTSPNALSAIGRELASNGYRRFIFIKPRKAVAEKGEDPLLRNLR